MRFAPVSEETAAGCFPKGEYDASVKSAIEKTSKAGNPMIEVTLTVYGDGGAETEVRDWLLSTDNGQRKLQAFCKSADLWQTYQAGELSADSCTGINVKVKLGTETDDTYGPRNVVKGYVPRNAPEKPAGTLEGVPRSQQKIPTRPDMTKPPTDADCPF